MIISDLNYLETATDDVNGGQFFSITDLILLSEIDQDNDNETEQVAVAGAFSFLNFGGNGAVAYASNENETYQSNDIN